MLAELSFNRVHHLTFADGTRFYCRFLHKTKKGVYMGPTGYAHSALRYEAISRSLPWQLTPEHDIPANFLG